MKRGVLLCCLLASVILGASSTHAAAIRRFSIEGGVDGGYNKIDADAEYQNASITGFHVGFALFPNFTIEAMIASTSTESAQQAFAGSDFQVDYAGLRLLASFRATEDVKVVPYIAAGGGRIKVEFDPGNGTPVLDDEATYAEIGAGARYFIWKGLNARGEILIRHARVLDVTHADAHFVLGISWMFGGKE
jgi:hypothetical protein